MAAALPSMRVVTPNQPEVYADKVLASPLVPLVDLTATAAPAATPGSLVACPDGNAYFYSYTAGSPTPYRWKKLNA